MADARGAFEVRGVARRPWWRGPILAVPPAVVIGIGAVVAASLAPPPPGPYVGAGCAGAAVLSDACLEALTGRRLPDPVELRQELHRELWNRAMQLPDGLETGLDPSAPPAAFFPLPGSEFWDDGPAEELVGNALREHVQNGGDLPPALLRWHRAWLDRPTVVREPHWADALEQLLYEEVEAGLTADDWLDRVHGTRMPSPRWAPPPDFSDLGHLHGIDLVREVVRRQFRWRASPVVERVANRGRDLYDDRLRAELNRRHRAVIRADDVHRYWTLAWAGVAAVSWFLGVGSLGLWAWQRRPVEIVAGPHQLRVGDRAVPWAEVRAPDWTNPGDPGVWLHTGRLSLPGHELDEGLAHALDQATRVATAAADPAPPDPEQLAALERLTTASPAGDRRDR